MTISSSRRLGAALAVGGLASILVATLFPVPRQAAASAATDLYCIVCGEAGGTDVFLNLLLFTPMAVGLGLLGWSWRRVLPVAALLSFTVELLQFSVVAGRDAALSDVLANTLGASAGAALTPLIPGLVAPDPVRARLLFPFALGVFPGVLALSAVGYQPGVVPGALWSACKPYPPTSEAWTGTLHSVVFNRDTLPCDRKPAGGAAIREALLAGEATLRIDALSGPRSTLRAPVHAVRVPRAPLLVLAQEGAAATLGVPTVSQRLRLFQLSLTLQEAFPPAPGVPIRLEGGQDGRRLWISSSYSGLRRSAEVTLSPSFGWTSLVWWRLRPGPKLRIFTAVWLGFLIFPAGYWAGSIGRPLVAVGGVSAALVTGLGGVPLLTGYPPAHWSEWAGGALGAALGWALHRFAAYLQSRCGSPSIGAYSSS
jgi:hypothetical protein